MRILIIISIVLLVTSCKNNKISETPDIIKYSQQDSMIYKFIVLYDRYTDATFDWHRIKDFNINIYTKRTDDTLKMYFYPSSGQDITLPILENCKFCYFVDSHYIFAQESIFSFPSLNIDTVYKELNSIAYSNHLRKEIIPPPVGWDAETLVVKLVNNKLETLSIGFDNDMYEDYKVKNQN